MDQALRIFVEVAPPGLKVDEVECRINALPGVASVHDLRMWTGTPRLDTATRHVVLGDAAERHAVLDRVTPLLAEEYHLPHATMQCEPGTHEGNGTPSDLRRPPPKSKASR